MKCFALLFSFLSVIFTFNSPKNATNRPEIACSSYVVMNRLTYEVIAGKDIHLTRSVASISKIMTAIIALESDHLFDIVEITPESTKQEGSSLYLKAGDKLTVIDLVYGLMLRSGNDAAHALATYLSQDIDSFKIKMNEKAKKIGMNDSTFNNPSGLDVDDDGNLSSAYDMARLFSYAMQNSIFSQIVGSKEYRCQENHLWYNKNKLLKLYEYCDGGKTGYTLKAKRTLVTGAKKGATELAIVTLNCGGDFSYHKALYEYYLNNFEYIPYLSKGNNYISEHLIISDKNIGLWKSKDEISDKCIKLYRFDLDGNLIEMLFIDENNKVERIEA